MERAPGELAVADLAPARAAHALRLAHGVGREVVVQHEVLAMLAFQRIDDLLVLSRAEGRDAERLGLAAGEQRAPVGAGQDADLADDGAHGLRVAAVDAGPGVEDRVADDGGLEVLQQRLCRFGVESLRGQRLERRALRARDLLLPGLLLALLIGFGERGAGERIDALPELSMLGGRLGERPRLLRRVLGQLDDGLDHRLHVLVAEGHGAEHGVLGQLLRLALDHEHALGRAGDDEVELGAFHLGRGRVEHILAVHVADAGRGHGAEERDAGQRQRRRAADHGDHVGVVLQVMAEHGGDDLHLVAEPFREQRADRAVDEPAGQHLLLGGASLPLEEAHPGSCRRRTPSPGSSR